ncbi:hypothetical protein C2845_PM01G31820 [Panicum miliaceum]|uniref:40S ribosomal protein S21 n=1 Tax=Panicum miliaceum TaxID=4540 RepID=A0A3L6TFB6_PANMI|nr:hypothetical protein C2845_PM01G31820 [Panicum miliaceum]
MIERKFADANLTHVDVIITAKDHASVQINIGHLDENGLYDGRFTTVALSGFVRAQGDADSSLDRLRQKRKRPRSRSSGSACF